MSSNGRAKLTEGDWAHARGAGGRGEVAGVRGFEGGGRSSWRKKPRAPAVMASGGERETHWWTGPALVYLAGGS